MSENKTVKVTTPEFRVSFPNVFQAASAFDGQPPTYNIQMLFDKDTDLSKIHEACKQVAREKWPDKKPANLRMPIRDGDEKEYEQYQGKMFANAKSKLKPGIVDQNLNEIIDPSDFYAGCYARATVTVYAYDKAGNKGVALGLQNLQKLRDGQAFSGRTSATDDFEAVEGGETSAGGYESGDEW